MRAFMLAFIFVIATPFTAFADENTPSKFRDTPYTPQNVVYEFNYQTPEEGVRALGYVRNHLRALEEFGDVAKDSHIVVVMHGYELHAVAREQREHFPEVYGLLQELTEKGVSFYVCRNSARGKGYDTDDFYDLTTVIPAGMSELGHWQAMGYSYINPQLMERRSREDLGVN
jgi:uncharacterized protein